MARAGTVLMSRGRLSPRRVAGLGAMLGSGDRRSGGSRMIVVSRGHLQVDRFGWKWRRGIQEVVRRSWPPRTGVKNDFDIDAFGKRGRHRRDQDL